MKVCSRSDNASNCSRNSEPSFSLNRRTQPMRSEDCARSIVEVATAGCQRSWPLKSRSTFQTAPVGASRIVLLTICGTGSASERALERIEAALEHTATDVVDQFGLALGRAVELGRPFHERLFTVGDRRQAQRRDIVLDPHRRLQNRIGAEHVEVRKPEQLLANAIAVAQSEIAHAADLVRGLAALDAALRDRRMPVRQTVEVAHPRPHPIVAGIDDGRNIDTSHDAPSTLLARRPRRRPLARGRGWLGLAFSLRCRLPADAPHVAGFANKARHLRKAAPLDTDAGENRIDQWRLTAVAQGRIDHFVGGAASAATAAATTADPTQPVDMQDADAFDFLHRLDALAHDTLDAVEQLAAEQRVARLIGKHVLGLVQQLL